MELARLFGCQGTRADVSRPGSFRLAKLLEPAFGKLVA